MKNILAVVLLFVSVLGVAQNKKNIVNEPPLLRVASPAVFPGGQEAFQEYIKNNLEYPEEALENDVQGSVYIQFVIDTLGNVTEVEVLRIRATREVVVKKKLHKEETKILKIKAGENDYCLGSCAVNLIANSPKWSPAIQKNKPVRVMYKIPITYSLH